MDRIQLRRDTSNNWKFANPILLEGEIGYEIDTKRRKIGDGVNHWNDLDYLKLEDITNELGNSKSLSISQDLFTKLHNEGYKFAGIANLNTVPQNVTADSKIYYITNTSGVYINFNNLAVADGEIAFFTYNGSWSKVALEDMVKKSEVVGKLNNTIFASNRTAVSREGVSVSDLTIAIKDCFCSFPKQEGLYYSFARIFDDYLELYSNNAIDTHGTSKTIVDKILIDRDGKGFRVSKSVNQLFTLYWNPNLMPHDINVGWYDALGLDDSCWDIGSRFYLGLKATIANSNVSIVYLDTINIDTINNAIIIPGYRICSQSSKYSSDTKSIINVEPNSALYICLFDTENLEFVALQNLSSIEDKYIYCFSFNMKSKKIWGLANSEYVIDGKSLYALNADYNAIDSWITNRFDVKPPLYIKNGVIKSMSDLVNNDNIAWLPLNNLWWVKVKITNEIKPIEGTSLNVGLVCAENKSNKRFRLLKCNTYPSSNKLTYVYHSRMLNNWKDSNTIFQSTDVVDTHNQYIGMALSGDSVQGYLNDELVGSAKSLSLSSDSRNTMYAGILIGLKGNIAYEYKYKERPTTYAHFSVDDVVSQLKDITDNKDVYTSIFDNLLFAFWKRLHNDYGVVVTFNMFYSDNNGWDLSMMTDKFKSDFIDNQSWLKLAFHGENPTIKYNDELNNESAVQSYISMINQVERFASLSCWDRMPRITFFSGNKALYRNLVDTGMFVGCLTADDTRENNCGLSEIERECINNSSDYVDFENGLYYVRSSVRLENNDNKNLWLQEIDKNSRNVVYEYFNHGQTNELTEIIAKQLFIKNIRFDFPQNNLPL